MFSSFVNVTDKGVSYTHFVHSYKLVTTDKEFKISSNLLTYIETPPLKGALHPLGATEGGPQNFASKAKNREEEGSQDLAPYRAVKGKRQSRSQPMKTGSGGLRCRPTPSTQLGELKQSVYNNN